MMHGNAPASLWRKLAPAFAAALSLSLGACASTGQASAGARPAMAASAAQPSGAGAYKYKVGAPYEANGVWFVPAEQPTYKDVGAGVVYASSTASTADGERFDANVFSAAHATLPMPAVVEVTNLENGRRLEVRVNDRGATQKGQVIALSRAAAEALGYGGKTSAKVQVRYLRPGSLDANAPRQTYATSAPGPAPVAAPAPVQVAKATPVAATPIAPPPVKAAPASQAAPMTAAIGGYAVQAGAFSNRANAERVVAKLGSAGQAAIRPLERGGATLYRVVVGPWSSETAASAAREQVAALGFGDAKVVRAF